MNLVLKLQVTFIAVSYTHLDVYKRQELDNKITAIADYIFNPAEMAKQSEEDMWVDKMCIRDRLCVAENAVDDNTPMPFWTKEFHLPTN